MVVNKFTLITYFVLKKWFYFLFLFLSLFVEQAKTVTSTKEFPITLSLHQRLALSPYMFTLVMDELIRSIENEINLQTISS
jgi:hypothetical protein